MRSRLLFLLTAVGMLASASRASQHGSDLWRIDPTLGHDGHWAFLAAGRVRIADARVPVVLLGELRRDREAGRYSDMKVVDGRDGKELWQYDGTGGDYVYARSLGTETDGPGWSATSGAPMLVDVDGDGSDDVVFVEEDTIWHTVLRAVRVTP